MCALGRAPFFPFAFALYHTDPPRLCRLATFHFVRWFVRHLHLHLHVRVRVRVRVRVVSCM